MKQKEQLSKTIEDCFNTFESSLISANEKAKLRTYHEENICAIYEYTLLKDMRLYWCLWWNESFAKRSLIKDYPKEKPEVVRYFNDNFGIFDPNDMSDIILKAYHRHINGKEIQINELVKECHDYWEAKAQEAISIIS